MTHVCLDLFSGLGGFSAAFEESDGWEVVTVDLDPDDRFDPDLRADLMDLRPSDLPDADVVLASPPCQVFSIVNQGNGDWADGHPTSDQARHDIALVYHTLGLIRALDPDYWWLENPRGILRTVIGPPSGTVTYCQYGTDYQKPTDLWGDHPGWFTYRSCSPGADCHVGNPRSEHPTSGKYPSDVAERSKVPYDLSLAIREAVEDAYANPPPEQVTLGQVNGP